MFSDTIDNFISWLDEQEKQKGWTDYRLAEKAKINPSVLSRARSGTIPKWDACMAIAQALNISPTTVFRKAGLLPDTGSNEITFDDWKYLIDQLSPEDEAELRQIAEMKIERRKKEQSMKVLKPRKAG